MNRPHTPSQQRFLDTAERFIGAVDRMGHITNMSAVHRDPNFHRVHSDVWLALGDLYKHSRPVGEQIMLTPAFDNSLFTADKAVGKVLHDVRRRTASDVPADFIGASNHLLIRTAVRPEYLGAPAGILPEEVAAVTRAYRDFVDKVTALV